MRVLHTVCRGLCAGALALLLCLTPAPARAFWASAHFSITYSAFDTKCTGSDAMGTLLRFWIADAAEGVDVYEFINDHFVPRFFAGQGFYRYRADHHFDRSKGVSSLQAARNGTLYVRGQIQLARGYLSGSDSTDFFNAASSIGAAAHALEDLFSHSNLVETFEGKAVMAQIVDQILDESFPIQNIAWPQGFRLAAYDPAAPDPGIPDWEMDGSQGLLEGFPANEYEPYTHGHATEIIGGQTHGKDHGAAFLPSWDLPRILKHVDGVIGYEDAYAAAQMAIRKLAAKLDDPLCGADPRKFPTNPHDPYNPTGPNSPTGSSPELEITPVGAQDPNSIIGPKGVGQTRAVTAAVPLHYEIEFENVPTATAAAQVVTVTNQLDPAKFDLSTFRLGTIGFGSKSIEPPQSTQQFGGFIDLRPALNLIVRIDAKLDTTTGLFTTVYTSVDPATGELTQDPTAGFLPPNKDGSQGVGTILYSVAPKTAAASGTPMPNRATIVFDVNPPLDTNVWLNVLDTAAPTSRIGALPGVSPSGRIRLTWDGSDEQNGAGLSLFDVFVSDNGGPFSPWMQGTTQKSGSYAGRFGHTYRFYAEAVDSVGNREDKKGQADTQSQAGQAPALPAGLHMVSLPVQSTVDDPLAVFGFSNGGWGRYDPMRDQGKGAYVTYGSDPGGYTRFGTPVAVPGRAYWLKLNQPVTPTADGPLPDDTLPYPIALKAGWNQIGNPYLVPVPWTVQSVQVQDGSATLSLRDAQKAGIVEDYLWGWQPSATNPLTGTYALVYDGSVIQGVQNRLEPWAGYWIYAHKDCTLILPPIETVDGTRAAGTRAAESKGHGWGLRIEAGALSDTGPRSQTIIGMAPAGRAMQIGSPPEPPEVSGAAGGSLRISSVRNEAPLAVDIQSGTSIQREWDILVEVPPAKTPDGKAASVGTLVTLRWPDVSTLPRDASVSLTDLQTNRSVFLRTASSYTFRAAPEGGRFKFKARTVAAGQMLRVLNVQTSGGRGPTDAHTISYLLTRDATVEVRVLSNGRLVRTLGSRVGRSSGTEQVLWDGRSQAGVHVPSGSYLVEVKAIADDGQVSRAVAPLLVAR